MMQKMEKIQKQNAKMILIILFSVICFSNIQIYREVHAENLIRIHVLANSNQEADQQLKLQVKDNIVRYLQPLLEQSQSIEESRQIIQNHIPQIKEMALQTLQQADCQDSITLQYGVFNFPTKYYGSFTLPSGKYEALRILIGEGKGHNWWCVLFPPLCFTDSNTTTSGKYTETTPETEIVVRFKYIEWLKEHTDISVKQKSEQISLLASPSS